MTLFGMKPWKKQQFNCRAKSILSDSSIENVIWKVDVSLSDQNSFLLSVCATQEKCIFSWVIGGCKQVSITFQWSPNQAIGELPYSTEVSVIAEWISIHRVQRVCPSAFYSYQHYSSGDSRVNVVPRLAVNANLISLMKHLALTCMLGHYKAKAPSGSGSEVLLWTDR